MQVRCVSVIRMDLRVNMAHSPNTASIHILDDDSLLHVFYLYRPFILGEDDDDDPRLLGSADAGGISLRMFVEGGETLYSGHHPTWISPLSAQKTRPLQTC